MSIVRKCEYLRILADSNVTVPLFKKPFPPARTHNVRLLIKQPFPMLRNPGAHSSLRLVQAEGYPGKRHKRHRK